MPRCASSPFLAFPLSAQMADVHELLRPQTDLKFSADGETVVEGNE